MKISRLFIECRTSDHANYCSSWKIYSQRISSLLISFQEMHLSMCLSMVSLVSSLNFLRQRGHSSTWTFSFSLVTSLLDVVVSLPKETGVSITSSAVSGWTSPPRYIELAELCLIGWVTARLAVAYAPWRDNKKDMFLSNIRNVHFVEFWHGITTTVVTLFGFLSLGGRG